MLFKIYCRAVKLDDSEQEVEKNAKRISAKKKLGFFFCKRFK